MLHIAYQTAGPIGLKFFVNTYGWSNFFPRATPGPSASLCNKTRHSNICSPIYGQTAEQNGRIFLREPMDTLGDVISTLKDRS